MEYWLIIAIMLHCRCLVTKMRLVFIWVWYWLAERLWESDPILAIVQGVCKCDDTLSKLDLALSLLVAV